MTKLEYYSGVTLVSSIELPSAKTGDITNIVRGINNTPNSLGEYLSRRDTTKYSNRIISIEIESICSSLYDSLITFIQTYIANQLTITLGEDSYIGCIIATPSVKQISIDRFSVTFQFYIW